MNIICYPLTVVQRVVCNIFEANIECISRLQSLRFFGGSLPTVPIILADNIWFK